MATEPESFEDFSAEELQNLKALAQDVDKAAEELNSTRRDVIKSLGLLGTGIAAGGISAQQLIKEVSAQASTTDSDGNVGLPSDRVDVYADGLDGNSATFDTVNADEVVINTIFDATGLDVSSDGSSETTIFEHNNQNGSVTDSRSIQSITGDNADSVLTNAVRGGFYVVIGHRGDGTSFVDLVLSVRSAGTVIVQSLERNGPGIRSYTHSATQEVTIAIDDAGETYNVVVSSISGDI